MPKDPVLEETARQGVFDPQTLCLAGGESYELIATFAPDQFAALAAEFESRFDLPLTAIGTVQDDTQGVRLDGHPLDDAPAGYDHFA